MLQFQVNNTSKNRWATMIELMAMLAILWLWLGSMFAVITSGLYFSKDTEDTIRAINLAREWIEWASNIRNTNWLRFSSDRQNCWKVDKYNWASCIGNTINNVNTWHIASWSHVLYTENWLWFLSGTTSIDPVSNWNWYASTYATKQDSTWFFNQTWSMTLPTCTNTEQKNCKSIFFLQLSVAISK